MRIVLETEESILLEPTPGPVTIEGDGGGHGLSPFHMLAGGLALCTFSVLHAWAHQAGVDARDLSLRVRWALAEEPRRIGTIGVEVIWPGLPEARRAAVPRAAAMCPIHKSFEVPPEVMTTVV